MLIDQSQNKKKKKFEINKPKLNRIDLNTNYIDIYIGYIDE